MSLHRLVLTALVWAPVILFLGLILVPFVDRSPWRSPGRRKWIVMIGAIVAIALIALAVYAGLTPAVSHVQDAAR